ncbi:hypothetical protein [Nostoc sp. WHI]|nr:hypothetical protein [Nostoc sp. WHI]
MSVFFNFAIAQLLRNIKNQIGLLQILLSYTCQVSTSP